MNDLREQFASILALACREAVQHSIYGTSRDHIESIVRLPDENGAFYFEVTSWNEESVNSRKVRKMSLIEVMDILAGYISGRATRMAAETLE